MKLVIPGEPQGKGRPRMTKTGHAYTPERTRQYEKLIKQCYYDQGNSEHLDGPLLLHITAYMQIPKSARKDEQKRMQQGKTRPTKKPDIDNVIKTIDALNGLAFEDDKQIVSVVAEKYYDYEPRLEIEINQI